MSKRTIRWASLAALGAILGTTAACGSQQASAKTSTNVLAVVNGQDLTVQDWQLATHATDLLQGVTMANTKAAKKKQITELADETAVEQYALKHKWVTKAKAATEAKTFVSENVVASMGGAAKAKTALKKAHLTNASLTEFMTQQMVLQAAFAHQVKNIKAPSNATMLAYYNAHKSIFTSPTQDQMRMILVKKKSLAESLMKQLENGGSWTTLAEKYSIDPGSKNKGGEYGWVDTGAQSGFVTAFYQEMDQLKPGQYGIAHSQYGYHVIEVQATKPGKVESYASVKSQLSSGLLQQNQDIAFQSFMTKIAKAATIKFNA